MGYANLVFHQTQNPNIFLFNSMIKGYSLCGPYENSLLRFSEMKNRGIWPDEFTFAPLLKSCSGIGDHRIGKGVHGEVIVVGIERFSSIRIGIVDLYTSFERMEDAQKVFDEMLDRHVVVWNMMIRGFCKVGDLEKGLCLFRQMTARSVVSWNSMIAGLEQRGRDGEALELLREMWDHGFEPDDATVVTILPVCARLGAVDVGERIHSYAESSQLLRNFISVGNSLVDFYCKCGNLETAWRVFNGMPQKNVVSWNAMISGLTFNGKGELGAQLFVEMINKGVRPNDATFVGVLSCCAHAGLVERGRNLFASMTVDHKLEPKLEHYGCMVDLLARNGCLEEAHDLLRTMPMRPNAVLWGSLLSAYRSTGKIKQAECVVKELIELEPWNSGNYVLLSNIYAEDGRWDEVEKVRALMKEKNIRKNPGQSMVLG